MASFKIALFSVVCFLMVIQFMEAASISSLPSSNDNKIPVKNADSENSDDKIPAIKSLENIDDGYISEAEIAAAKLKCGGGCMFSTQCSSYDGGNSDCRCSWFSCKLYNKKTGKEIK